MGQNLSIRRSGPDSVVLRYYCATAERRNTMSYMKHNELLEKRPTQVRLRPDQRPKLEAIIEKEDRDLSWIIRKALDEFIDRYSKKKK